MYTTPWLRVGALLLFGATARVLCQTSQTTVLTSTSGSLQDLTAQLAAIDPTAASSLAAVLNSLPPSQTTSTSTSTGASTSTSTSFASSTLVPLATLGSIANATSQEQRSQLKAFGYLIQQQTGQACNVYGGEESCMTLPADSNFARLCPEHNLKVDCAYYSEELAEVQADPQRDLRSVLQDRYNSSAADLEAACPECFENQRRMYCLTAAPKCGSFAARVETAILPAVQQAVYAYYAQHLPLAYAVQLGVPGIVQSVAYSLPCKQMCRALLDTCSCGDTLTVGEVWAEVQSRFPNSSRNIVDPIRNRSVCDMFMESSMPGFAGHCEAIPATCSNREPWCPKANNGSGSVAWVSQQMLFRQAVGLLIGAQQSWVSSLLGDDDDTKYNIQVLSDGGAAAAAAAGNKHSALVVTLVVLLAISIACLLGGAVYMRKRLRDDRHLGGGGGPQYVAMTEATRLVEPPIAEL